MRNTILQIKANSAHNSIKWIKSCQSLSISVGEAPYQGHWASENSRQRLDELDFSSGGQLEVKRIQIQAIVAGSISPLPLALLKRLRSVLEGQIYDIMSLSTQAFMTQHYHMLQDYGLHPLQMMTASLLTIDPICI
jgi:hypothetical protein